MKTDEFSWFHKLYQIHCSSNKNVKPKKLSNKQEVIDLGESLSIPSNSTKVSNPGSLLNNPQVSIDELVKDIPTDFSNESYGNVIAEPKFKLKSKFLNIQQSLTNRKQIYETLLKLDHVENGEYKVENNEVIKDIEVLHIAKSDSVDWFGQYSIQLKLWEDLINISAKWDVDIELFKEILELLHGLKLTFTFDIDSDYFTQRKESINDYLMLIGYGNNFMFYWDTIRYNFSSEISEKSTYSSVNYYCKILCLVPS